MIKTSLAALGAACAMTFGSVAMAQDVKGNIVFLDWLGGGEGELLHKLEDGFKARNPGVTFTNVPVSFTADPRGGIRTVLGGGEAVDIMPNTWPAFRAELADAGLLVPLDDMWKGPLGKNLAQAWRDMGSYKGTSYGVPWRYGNRSGLWFRTDVLKKNGLTPPKTYEEFVAGFKALNAAGVKPLAIPAKAWAHGEVFENLLVRMYGIDVAQQLVDHKISWTDKRVKATLLKLTELLKANCCGDAAYMLGSEWDNAADDVLLNGKAGYLLIGTWVNTRAMKDYHLKPNVDYASIQFPAMGLGFDDAAIIDTREMNVISTGKNHDGAKAFIEYIASEEGSNLIASAGLTPPSSQTNLSLLDPVSAGVAKVITASKVIFVLGDQLPGDVVDEFRVQLQHVIQNPTESTIDTAVAAMEAKAMDAY